MTHRLNRWGRAFFSLGLMLSVSVSVVHAAPIKTQQRNDAVKTKSTRVQVVPKKSRQLHPSVVLRSSSSRTTSAGAGIRLKASKSERISVRQAPSTDLYSLRASSARPSSGAAPGFQATTEDLGLKSNAVMVMDQQTHQVLFDKNATAVLPIASLTKLMTGLVVTDAGLPLDELIAISEEDVDTLKGSSSRLSVGTMLTRGELLHLALMSSENRAAHALGRTFPGGVERFVEAMNAKSKLIGMSSTRFVDPTGLSPQNQSSARDLVTLVSVASERPVMRDLSTSPSYEVASGNRVLQYHNTNRLVTSPEWEIGLQKTGYISEAGRCLVMQARIAGRQLIMVFLDSAGKLTRIADAERVRKWMETQSSRLL